MPVHAPTRRPKCRRRFQARAHLLFESLEARDLPSVAVWPGLLHPVAETEPNDTLDKAQDLGDLSVSGGLGEAVGAIGKGVAGPADVDWFHFTIDRAANVTLTTLDRQAKSPLVSALSLYNDDTGDFSDPYDPLQHRLLVQADGAAQSGDAHLDRPLGPGSYFVAVSGSGNRHFHPLLANSGSDGSTGAYGLQITATDIAFDPGAGPAVLVAEPAANGTLDRSPFVLRFSLSAALDPNTVIAGQTVQLFANSNDPFTDGTQLPVTLSSANFSPAANELQLMPAAPLAPGYYEVVLSGDNSANAQVLADLNGTPLGMNSAHPTGQDFTEVFQITGSEGVLAKPGAPPTADDTAATAHALGDITAGSIVQATGAIGDDPAYDPNNSDPTLSNPAADVDMYHFRISGPDRYAVVAEVFAGRIGSPLDPAVGLFQRDSTGKLQLIDVNDNTLNNSMATDGSLPLFTDSALYAGLTAGDYYLAVSGTGNLPDPSLGILPGSQGVFDPNVSHSGMNGYSTGPYVLSVQARPDALPPQVVTITPSDGTALDAPPTQLQVQFNKPVNLQQLAYQVTHQNSTNELAAVYVRGSDGREYHPRLVSYDATTAQATFLMLDGLSSGAYQLHLSGTGPLGLKDLGGIPLAGNGASGDFVTHFTVNIPPRGTNGDPRHWLDQEPNDDPAHPQVLGVLFPHELQKAGVTLTRDFTANPGNAPSDGADCYQFAVLQDRDYILSLNGSGLPAGALPTLTDATGKSVPTLRQGTGGGVRVHLQPGTYVVRVGGWSSAHASTVTYQLHIALGYSNENPTPLTVGPAPAYRFTFVGAVAAVPPAAGSSTPPAQNATPPANTTPPVQNTTPPANPTPPVQNTTPPANPTPPAQNVTPPADSTLPASNNTRPVNNTPLAQNTTPPANTRSAAPNTTLPVNSTPLVQNATSPTNSTSTGSLPSLLNTPPSAAPVSSPPTISLPVSPAPAPAVLPGPLPAERGNAGVAQAVVQNASGPGTTVAEIPASILATMRAVPIGGERDLSPSAAPAFPDRAVARGPDVPFSESHLRLLILTRAWPDQIVLRDSEASLPAEQSRSLVPQARLGNEVREGNPRLPASNLAAVVNQYARTWQTIWKRTLDNLFLGNWFEGQLKDWLKEQPAPAPEPIGTEERNAGEGDSLGQGELGAVGPSQANAVAGSLGGAWFIVLPAAGMLGGVDARERRRARPGVGLNGESEE